MERLLIQGGHEYLPFARSRIRALKTLGMRYVSQTYTVNGVTINVRLENGTEHIRIDGGKHRLLSGFLANGFVTGDVLDAEGNVIGQLPAVQPTPDGSIKYRMGKFWPRDDLRKKDETGWLESGKKPETLANLDLTLNGTSFRMGQLPFPDARACEYGKRGPASLYTGTMRKVVQVLLGRCEGEPRVETTPEKDRLEYGFNNADIPYAYTFDKSHGVFTCSDHTKEKPNVWVIEISSQRGVLAWKMDTRKVSKTGNPDLYETLGYLPVPTPRPVSTDANQRGLRSLWDGDGELSAYFAHGPLYQDCGWAFSYSGRRAANVSFEYNYSESGARLLSVWAHLWEIAIDEGAVVMLDGTQILAPTSLSVVQHERNRAAFDVNNSIKVPGVVPLVGRTLLTQKFGGNQQDPVDAGSPVEFPVYAYYQHDSDDLQVFRYKVAQQEEPDEPDQDERAILRAAEFRTSWADQRLRFGLNWVTAGGGFIGPGMAEIVDSSRFLGTETIYTLGEVGPINGPFPGRMWARKQRVIRTSYQLSESIGRHHTLIVPFGDREAIYGFFVDIKSSTRSGPSIVAHWGVDVEQFEATLSDAYDGPLHIGANIDIGPNTYQITGDQYLYWGGSWFPGPGRYFQPNGGVFQGLLNPADYPVYEELSPDFPLTENQNAMNMKLVTSKLMLDVPTYGFLYGDPAAPENGPFNLEQFVILGDTMSNHLIDVTAEAFTGAVVAAEGQYRGGEYNTFISSGTEDYPAIEIDFRFGYWIGVPMHKGKQT